SFYLLFTALLGVTAWALGSMLARRFLTPIRELSVAVEAIERREFQHRLPLFTPDELGRLALTFNRVMEGLSDLEVARIVQENLFPKDELRIGEYCLFGRSFPATELGGDYLDLRLLPEDRVLIVIGDVSGHGVPAALVMALAKGAADVQCEKNAAPNEILGAMNRALVGSVRRKRFMTCFLAVLDTRRHELCFSNAGHCDPILIGVNGTVEHIVNRNHVLGIKSQTVFSTSTLEVNPGDRIVLYTDGLVETRASTGQIGFSAAQDVLPKLFDDDLPTSCRRMYQWAADQNIAPCQEDDITIVLFARVLPA
ncbi:MAG TPA: SpoIIE family protein phosphatase, partial [Candidatus Ozemobacteraceae bacterium]|nr:SpoIIE family protein phosphatase [Candidatus Ozemobacteraceae bacterium]